MNPSSNTSNLIIPAETQLPFYLFNSSEVYRPYKKSISKEMNNDNHLNLQMSSWLHYCYSGTSYDNLLLLCDPRYNGLTQKRNYIVFYVCMNFKLRKCTLYAGIFRYPMENVFNFAKNSHALLSSPF